VHAERHHPTGTIVRKYLDAGKPAPFAVVIGHHPVLYLGSLWKAPWATNEYTLAGGVLQEAVRLTESEIWGSDFLIPRDADIVLEGEVLPDSSKKKDRSVNIRGNYQTVRGGKVDLNHDPAERLW
jgi:UbiD family decarboxylase